ncbi:MAPEG family protein [Devosia sp.]|uniref:MAPEG family protein n=1 Tax=Devosia sp. TaxID=1871048 RepID=UPI003A91AE7F
MSFPVTSIYAAIFTVLVIVLANIVSARRGKTGISILHGDDMNLALWIRRHGNLLETLPLALLLMALCEAAQLPALWLNAFGIGLLAARLAHLIGLSVDRPTAPLRIAGGALTQLLMLAAAAWLIWSLL